MSNLRVHLDSTAILEFCRKWNARELSVFGSALRDDFSSNSDIDFLIEPSADAQWDLFDLMDMQDELAKIAGRDVDLMTRNGLESSQNKVLRREILSTRELLYAA